MLIHLVNWIKSRGLILDHLVVQVVVVGGGGDAGGGEYPGD